MAAYMIVDEDVFNLAAIDEYGAAARPTIVAHGGKALIRTTECLALEGDWKPKRLVVLEFESKEAALNWYNSPEYQATIPLRKKGANTNFLLVEGI